MGEILLVDDNLDLLWLVRTLLEQEGMTVQCAESGEEALYELGVKAFCMMITDLDLPGLNGLALTRKALEIAPCMPVIMITGNISPEIPQLAEEVGIARVLAKPFHSHEIIAAIRDACSRTLKNADC